MNRYLRIMKIAGGKDSTYRNMFMTVIVIVTLTALILAGYGCGGHQNGRSGPVSMDLQKAGPVSGLVKHARCFRIEPNPAGFRVILSDPWKSGKVFARYQLCPGEIPKEREPDITYIPVPVKDIVASSTTHAGFLTAIEAGELLTGLNNPERLYDSVLYERFTNGRLLKMGRDLEYNLEFLVSLHPSLVLQTGIEGQYNPDPRLKEMGIPVFYILEWMESSPLGRAEWIKVFGLLTGRSRLSDSLFSAIESRYLDLRQSGAHARIKPRVFTGTDFKGTWYMPGGKNFMAGFFRDAGMDYPWASVDQSASLALSFEAVLNEVGDAEIWIGVPVDSASQLLDIEKRYSYFRAVREKRVFTLTNRRNNHGGNDYWETGPVRPDLILQDMLAIAQPFLLKGHNWNYLKPLIFD